jgi:hypothetical protein
MYHNDPQMARKLRFRHIMSVIFPTRSLIALMAIGVIDLVSTAVMHKQGLIVELNPLMKPLITQSEWLFAFVKGLTIGGAWGALAWYARQNKKFVGQACTLGSLAYVFVWCTWFFSAA